MKGPLGTNNGACGDGAYNWLDQSLSLEKNVQIFIKAIKPG